MNSVEAVPTIEALAMRLLPLRKQVAEHPLYAQIHSPAHIRIFMETHVFAVWDFMSLLKTLQQTLTCLDVPWIPTRFPASRRFINEIVLGEESDEYQGRPVSHFEVYLEAMTHAHADTRAIARLVNEASHGFADLSFDGVPSAARAFVENTFHVIQTGTPAAQAAVFAFSREDAIPDMFRSLVRQLNTTLSGRFDPFVWYLQRHIEVDGEDHGPISLRMVADLCGEDTQKWEEAAQAAEAALRARMALWNGVLDQLRGSSETS